MTYSDPTASFPTSVVADASVGLQSNRETNTLNADMQVNTLSIVLADDTSGMPNTGFVTIDTERILYTSKNDSTRTLTVSANGRGADGSQTQFHAAGASVYMNPIARHYNALLREMQAVQAYLKAGYIPAGAGPPSSTPAAQSGAVATYYDTTNNFLYIYNGGWKKSTVYA